MTGPNAETARRNTERGKAHRVNPEWRTHFWSETTICGIRTKRLPEAIPVERTAPEDRCRKCFKVSSPPGSAGDS